MQLFVHQNFLANISTYSAPVIGGHELVALGINPSLGIARFR